MNPNRLLAIDDDPDICELVESAAEEVGFDVTAVIAHEQFREAYRAGDPSVIILDLQMPEVDGIELLQFLGEARCRASIVLISGADTRVLRAARTLGAKYGLDIPAMMRKPFDISALESILLGLLVSAPEITERDLKDMIENQQFVVLYQPKIDLNSSAFKGEASANSHRVSFGHSQGDSASNGRALEGFEALVRGAHSKYGTLPPDSFIPLAESCGLIRPITDFVVRSVLTQIGAWKDYDVTPTVAINLSSQLLADSSFPDRLSELLIVHGVDNSRIVLEVTETAAMTDPAQSMEILTRLRLKGFALSLDDFGTGYSSLVQLHRMPFSELKIDKSFVMELNSDKEAALIVDVTIDLAHKLGMTACAEGVENAETLQFLSAAGCDMAQGYYLGRPAPAENFAALLAQQQERRNVV